MASGCPVVGSLLLLCLAFRAIATAQGVQGDPCSLKANGGMSHAFISKFAPAKMVIFFFWGGDTGIYILNAHSRLRGGVSSLFGMFGPYYGDGLNPQNGPKQQRYPS